MVIKKLRNIKLLKFFNKKVKVVCVVSLLLIFIVGPISSPNFPNILTALTQNLFNSSDIYTTEIKNLEIQSDDEQVSWHIDKSAEWTDTNKVQVAFDVNSVMKTDEHYKDIIIVLDKSGSMSGSKTSPYIVE